MSLQRDICASTRCVRKFPSSATVRRGRDSDMKISSAVSHASRLARYLGAFCTVDESRRMASDGFSLLLLFTLWLVGACGSPDSKTAEQSTVENSATTAADTIPIPASTTLSWEHPTANVDGSTLVDLAGYRIHYGLDPTDLNRSITIANPSISIYVIDELTAGTWYFGVATVNRRGDESTLSALTWKTIG